MISASVGESRFHSVWIIKFLMVRKPLSRRYQYAKFSVLIFMGIPIPHPLLLYFLLPGTIASLAAFAILIFTTVLAGILIVAPVAGLRPMRAFLFTRTSFPIPGRVKDPVFLVSETASPATSSMIMPEVFL